MSRPVEATQLIGRLAETERLQGALERLRGGYGSIVILAGEAGVGKTRLAEHVLAESGLTVASGQAREDATPPYGPVTAALRTYLKTASADAHDLGPLSPYLSMLIPELGPPPDGADPDLLVEAVIGAWIAAARLQSVILFMDDLQWADNATLGMIPVLAERIADEPLLLLGTYRSDEITRGHPIRRLRTELRRSRLCEEITLGPIGRDDTGRILERALGSPPSASLIDLVHGKTHGVPLYVEELASSLLTTDRLQEGDGGVELAPGEAVPIPESIQDAVLLRLDALPDAARHLLEIASVAGMEFDLELVTGLAGEETAVEELVDRGWIVENAPGWGAFRHALIREAIRGQIAWSRRRALNRRVASYLDRIGAPPEQVAEHWLAANENEPARRALLELAQRSCRLHAYRDAARAGHRALEIWPEGEAEDERIDTLLQLAHCAQVTGQLGDAVQALREVVDVTENEIQRAKALRALATVHGLQGSVEQSLETRSEAARIFERNDAPSEAAVDWLAVSGRLTARNSLDQALDAVRKAGVLAAASGRQDLIIHAKGLQGNLLAMRGEAGAGRELAQTALSLALQHNHTEAAGEAYRRLASVLDYSSDFAGSRDAYDTAVAYCREQGDDVNARVCLGCMSFIVYRTGEWKRAIAVSREVLNDSRLEVGSRLNATVIVGLIRAIRGETRPARKRLQQALSSAEHHQLAIPGLFARFGLALISEFEDDAEEAARRHEEILEAWRDTEDRHDLVPVFLWQSTFFARLEREVEATQRADALATMASGTDNRESMSALAHALGEVSLLAGKATEAVGQFRQALVQGEALEIPLEIAITHWRLGTALARTGDRETAARHLTRAYRTTRNLGARPVSSWILGELTALGERVEEGRHPDAVAREARRGLTRRQVEIVRLIADGLTNKEIASRLFLSPRTVDMHVRNLLDRLDCRGRTEAVRKAVDLGILD